jgi:hypothetical protein
MHGCGRWVGAALALSIVATGLGCTTDPDEPPPTGIEVVPPEAVEFGTVYECTSHHEEVKIINHGPDTEDISVDVDSLIYAHMVINNFLPELTLEPGDEYSLAIGVSPGAGGAAIDGGLWDGSIFITTQDRAIEIKVSAEIVVGSEC